MDFLIIEFDHYESLYAIIKCLQNKTANLHICSNKTIIKQLQNIDFERDAHIFWYEAEDPKGFIQYIQQISSIQFDFFIIAPSSDFKETMILMNAISSKKKILWIHNVNFWFKMSTRYKIFRRPRNTDHRVMLKIIDMSDAIIVLEENLKAYLRSIGYKKDVIVFPYSIYEQDDNNYKHNDKINIAVPGIIEKHRRNYDLVLNVFGGLDKNKFKLKLLGLPRDQYGIDIILRADKMILEGYDIYYLKSYELFEEEMRTSNIIFSPINVITSFAGVKEVYGISKSTGVIFDIIRYSKPGILPDELNIPNAISASVCSYKNENHLKEIFSILEHNPFLEDLTKRARTASNTYQKDVVSERLLEQLSSLKKKR